MENRDLEKVRKIIKEATDLDVSYAYDDMVFPEHTVFILQFDENKSENIFCYFHQDCVGIDQEKIFGKLTNACTMYNSTLELKGKYYMQQKGEMVDIHFLAE